MKGLEEAKARMAKLRQSLGEGEEPSSPTSVNAALMNSNRRGGAIPESPSHIAGSYATLHGAQPSVDMFNATSAGGNASELGNPSTTILIR